MKKLKNVFRELYLPRININGFKCESLCELALSLPGTRYFSGVKLMGEYIPPRGFKPKEGWRGSKLSPLSSLSQLKHAVFVVVAYQLEQARAQRAKSKLVMRVCSHPLIFRRRLFTCSNIIHLPLASSTSPIYCTTPKVHYNLYV